MKADVVVKIKNQHRKQEDWMHSKHRTKVKSNTEIVPNLNEHSIIFIKNVDLEETGQSDLWK